MTKLLIGLLFIAGVLLIYKKVKQRAKDKEIENIVEQARARADLRKSASAEFNDIDSFKTGVDLHTAMTLTEAEMYPKVDELSIDRARKEAIDRILGSDFQDPSIDQNNVKEKP